jgi:cytoskeletal protein CcmA (bactofilin family)
MTIFQRPEKPTDTDLNAKPVSRETARETSSAPETNETKRAQTVVQPIAQSIPSAAPAAKPVSTANSHGALMTSVISKALKITGQLESSEDIQIEGQIDGDVRGVHVKVGSNAKVKGTVYGEEVEVAGTVEGKIEAKKVILASTAHMAGDVVHADIRIESGAFIDGHCKPEYGKVAETKPAASKPTSIARTAAE